jgi:hypothetical protein
MTSHHPMDELYRYCGNCKEFENPLLSMPGPFSERLASAMGSIGYWVLDDSGEAVPFRGGVMEWALRMWGDENSRRQIAESFTQLYRISTIFLGLDHSFGRGPPILFETMVFELEPHEQPGFGGTTMDVYPDLEQIRYSNRSDAIAGHNALVKTFLKREADALARLKQQEKERK